MQIIIIIVMRYSQIYDTGYQSILVFEREYDLKFVYTLVVCTYIDK